MRAAQESSTDLSTTSNNRLFEWADALRIAGNEAAHDVKVTTSKEDARDILELTNALLEYVFTFRDRGGSGWLDSFAHSLSGASRVVDYAAVRRVVRLS